MYRSSVFSLIGWLVFAIVAAAPDVAGAQEHQHPPATQDKSGQKPQDDHAQHTQHADQAASLFAMRESSGTAWLPDQSPMYARHGRAGQWELMAHGNAFVQFLYEDAEPHHGAHQAGSINWVMGMTRRPLGSGLFGARAMFSLEPWTIRGCGYPDLLATGETCDGETIHDRQHPHDLVMELAAEYQRPLGRGLRWHVYGGPAGEPALGPPAYPHRPSAIPNPIAPIGHHWLDATHITFGVLTTGISGGRWRAEASAFNGREPDENRHDVDLAAMDSYSARLTLLPTDRMALQVSAGRLNDAEVSHSVGARVDVTRVTASAMYHRPVRSEGLWASTVAWGINGEAGSSTHALLVESTVSLNAADTWFGRFEVAGKPAHDFHADEFTDVFTVGKLQAGYVRYLRPRSGLQTGFGGSVSASLVPAALEPRFGSRVNPGFSIFMTVRPRSHRM